MIHWDGDADDYDLWIDRFANRHWEGIERGIFLLVGVAIGMLLYSKLLT